MNRRMWLLLVSVPVIWAASFGIALAGIMDFTIEGTYGETLTDGAGRTLFTMGDGFTIQGQVDTGQQPVSATKASGDFTFQDESLALQEYYFSFIDYSKVFNVTFTNISLDQINSYYPSDPNVFADDDLQNGSYMVDSGMVYSDGVDYFSAVTGSTFAEINDFTELIVTDSSGVFDAYINYDYQEEITGSDPFTVVRRVNSTIPLNISKFQTIDNSATVPEPAAIFLTGSGLLGLMGFRRSHG